MGNVTRIETLDDIERMLSWIELNTQKPNISFYRHVFHRLYAGGNFEAVNVDALIRLVSKNRLWSDQLNVETETAPEILRDRLARRIRWINKDVLGRDDSPYQKTFYIEYNRSSSRYQIVTDKEQVQKLRNRRSERRTPGIVVEVLYEELKQGEPMLQAGGELEFSIRSSITGYIHIFHADGNSEIDKLFPELGSTVSLKVIKGKELFFPDAVSDLCALKRWRIDPVGSEPVKQRLLVLVTEKNAKVEVSDVMEYFGIKTRGISSEKTTLGDLTPRQKLSSIAEYWLNSI